MANPQSTPVARICTHCHVEKPFWEFYASKTGKYGRTSQCRECLKTAGRDKRWEDPDQRRAKDRARYAANHAVILARKKAERARRPDTYRINTSRWRLDLRLRVLSHYSKGEPRCACCGETMIECLTIDHVNGDGLAHRRQIGRNMTSARMYHWLRSHGYPEGFQVLCLNCNLSKQRHGACPHQKPAGSADWRFYQTRTSLAAMQSSLPSSGQPTREPAARTWITAGPFGATL